MNRKILIQILEESQKIPDKSLNFNTWLCVEDGKLMMCPIGQHILNHPELTGKLEVKSDAKSYDGHHKMAWDVKIVLLSEYLDISYEATEHLFSNPCLNRDEFVESVTEFVAGKIDIRECCHEQCCNSWATYPEDTRRVCNSCKDELLEMCGI